jgi:hypothetical protein
MLSATAIQLLQIDEDKSIVELKVERGQMFCLHKQIYNIFLCSKFKQEKKGIISYGCV